jgi:hypothetical protein
MLKLGHLLIDNLLRSYFKQGQYLTDRLTSVPDLHHLEADLDPDPCFHFDAHLNTTFHSDTDPDPIFHIAVDLDPAPHNSDANLRPLLHFEPPRLQYERLRPL